MRSEQAYPDGSARRRDETGALPRHVAVIMDGNGRWATRRGLPRSVGHRAGARAVSRVVEAARRQGIATLTLFAFSADNWRRPPTEVDALMGLFERYLGREARRCAENGIRLRVIGRRDRLPVSLIRSIVAAEALTTDGEAMELRIAVDYSGRDAILEAVALLPPGISPTRQDLLAALGRAGCGGPPEVDLLLRTGGEHRISDFLLWEIAWAEVFFSDRLWPDVTDSDLAEALGWFSRRERRFGGLPSTVPISDPASGDSRETPVHAA
jgi:undecaprenyl diphosphate synthase